ncbi:brix domain-containing protein [Babesia ovis]|uniref:Brix domain-containing protein n=1 Tax=Babesia ovis TaxID=5869 RepID=A0A9W5WUR0_BABOV|nr:brix domain-containing protein [Babesia ovis]
MEKVVNKKSKADIKKQLVEKGESIRKSMEDIVKQDVKANTSSIARKSSTKSGSIAKHKENVNVDSDSDDEADMDPYRLKDAYYIKQNTKYTNKKKTMVLASRGISSMGRQLMKDIRLLLPHHKEESKLEKKDTHKALNTLAELSGCNSVIFIESRKGEMYIWIALTPYGPTFKGRLSNIHTLRDSTFFGNCLLYSRPLVTFDAGFDSAPHLQLAKGLISQVFGTPNNHPKSKPFYDHCLSFFYFDGRIVFRHYQIGPENEYGINKPDQQVLTEIGPQFVIEPIITLAGSFNGAVLWQNPNYISPIMMRRAKREAEALRREEKDLNKKNKKEEVGLPEDELSIQKVFSAPI